MKIALPASFYNA